MKLVPLDDLSDEEPTVEIPVETMLEAQVARTSSRSHDNIEAALGRHLEMCEAIREVLRQEEIALAEFDLYWREVSPERETLIIGEIAALLVDS